MYIVDIHVIYTYMYMYVHCRHTCTCMYSSQCVGFCSIPQPGAAEKDCSHALELDPDNIKALYRRGVARKVSYCIHFYSLSVSVSISNMFSTSSLR